MREIPENASRFFMAGYEEVCFKSDVEFVRRLESDTQLRQFVYPKLDALLKSWQHWHIFLTLVIDCAALMQTESVKQAKDFKKQAEKLQLELIDLTEQLAEKIDALNNLGKKGFIHTPYFEITEVMFEAGLDNYLFESYIKGRLQKSIAGFDSKYFPSLSDVVYAIGTCHKIEAITFNDHYTEIGKRASPRDFCIKLHSSIKENIRVNNLPKNFKLTQSEIADFCNALLGETISAENVKTYLAEFRKNNQSN